MKKIPTLFEREFENHRIVRILPNISPDLAWVMAGDGVATIKWDGACCAVINGVFYKRYDAKHGKPVPPNAIKCQENADPVTGHLPCWVPCDRTATGDKLWGDRIFEKCGIRRDERGDGGKTLEIRGKRRLSARDGGANYQQS